MSLKLYLDSATTNEVTAINPDTVKQAVESGGTIVDEVPLWMESSNSGVTYENIEISATNTPGSPAVTVQYAPDNAGSAGAYVNWYEPANNSYTTAHKFWRKVTVSNVTGPFNRTDIEHKVMADEYAV